ncbi:sensor histidine kinase [Xylophilus sp. ASV27]|uniref:sensor histidine kinase n=1 Tax=Xylophilus sp. ASV27 TaxID=2795129 RepID=UPI0018EB9D80|nr:sensor histidine kinase [Xylophilus sp. ASV27]
MSLPGDAAPRPPSLRSRVLQHVLWPLAGAWTVGGVVSLLVASGFTQRTFDRALLDDAYSVATGVRAGVEGLELTLTPREVSTVLYDHSESMYFAVRGPDGDLVAGHAGLYAPGPVGEAGYRFSDVQYQGRALRAVVLRRSVPQAFEVVMAETTHSRQALLRNVLVLSVLPQLLLLAVLAVWLRRAIGRDLRPLAALQHAVERRDVRDLTPVPANASTREVRRLGEAVNGLFARVNEGVRMQREFAGNVAHELRTPLAGIRALAEYGLAQKDPAVWRAQLERIAQSEDRASHMVEQLLAMARADEGRSMQLQPVPLDELVRDTVLRFLPRADSAGVDLGARGIDDPVLVQGQPALLEGILTNLLDNALRYGRPADGTQATITVAVTVQPDAIGLAVLDNGPGISAERRSGLQRRWAQGPEGVWLGQGAGLGLAIVQRYAELLGARLVLDTGPQGRGLAAGIVLPRA